VKKISTMGVQIENFFLHLLKINTMPQEQETTKPERNFPHEDVGDPFFQNAATDQLTFEAFQDRKAQELDEVAQQMHVLRTLLEEKEVIRRRLRKELGI